MFCAGGQVITIVSLCAGDGFADILGRRFGQKHKIPWYVLAWVYLE